MRAHFIRQSPEGGQFTSGGGSLLRSQVSGGTLYYVAKCPGGCLLRSRVSGGHSTTGGRLLRDRPDGTAIRDHARVCVYTSSREKMRHKL